MSKTRERRTENLRNILRKDTPTLFFNFSDDDRKAYEMFLESDIKFMQQGPHSEPYSPLVLWGYKEYRGLEQVEEFIREYQEVVQND
ncbi:MAG: hypothetical protein KJ767_00360 [Nanoarchaeota archaeon]|nr:hypothetical protein [Nanoarchaeota archaeon]